MQLVVKNAGSAVIEVKNPRDVLHRSKRAANKDGHSA